jgi:hypothetical protein
MLDVSGITGAGPIWHDFMVTVLRDTPPREFERPEGLVQVEVCADSGLLPTRAEEQGSRGAEEQGSREKVTLSPCHRVTVSPCPNRRLEWFIAGTEPTEVDRMHRQVAIDVRSGEPAAEFTPAEYIHVETYWILPPEFQEWARENHIAQPSQVSSLKSQVEDPRQGDEPATCDLQPATCNLRLASPDPNRVYRLDPLLPASTQRLPITARPGPELVADAPITLLLDGTPLATVRGPDYTAWWPLIRGQHVFQAVATGPDGTRIVSANVIISVEE